MTDQLCIECHQEPIFNKKRGLGNKCYQKFRNRKGSLLRETYLMENTRSQKQTAREFEFIKNFFNHTNWIHHPAIFRLDGISYEPDFYDGQRNTFIEVTGTKQAYSANKPKYQLLRTLFPKLNFEIRIPLGDLLDENVSINSQLDMNQ